MLPDGDDNDADDDENIDENKNDSDDGNDGFKNNEFNSTSIFALINCNVHYCV